MAEEEEREKMKDKIFKKIMAENFQNLLKTIKLHIQDAPEFQVGQIQRDPQTDPT